MNKTSARCGHVKRRLRLNQPLTGGLLQFALDAVGYGMRKPTGDVYDSIATKLRSGALLDDYEMHFMLDVVLLHVRLAATHQHSTQKDKDGPGDSDER